MIAYERTGDGPPVVCLHGWPGNVSDYRELVPLLSGDADVVVPHLLGYGDSYTEADLERPASDFGRTAQASAVIELMEALDLGPAIVVGYDVGQSLGPAIARQAPERVRALVLGNTLHSGTVVEALDDHHRAEFWYQDFHQLALGPALVDGSESAVRAYLDHFWRHWGHRSNAVPSDDLVAHYTRRGAFTVSLNWYRSGSATLSTALAARGVEPPSPLEVPATVLWGARDPLFPTRMSEGLERLLPRVDLRVLEDVGHFGPLEAAGDFADAVRAYL